MRSIDKPPSRWFNPRVIAMAVGIGLAWALLVSFVWDGGALFIFLAFAGGIYYTAARDKSLVLSCPQCLRRVPMRAALCPHCSEPLKVEKPPAQGGW